MIRESWNKMEKVLGAALFLAFQQWWQTGRPDEVTALVQTSSLLLPGNHARRWWIQRENFTTYTQWKVWRRNCPESTQSKVLTSFGFGCLSVNPRPPGNGRHGKEKNLECCPLRTLEGSKYKMAPSLFAILPSFFHSVISLSNSAFPRFVSDKQYTALPFSRSSWAHGENTPKHVMTLFCKTVVREESGECDERREEGVLSF